ncbi:MAG TPA: response regulator transcription factor [Candidatus Dormibacteraeota bacterium]|nr:response regulator transcription factor [Candidatus Dormibacteraeota bacterium]
MSQFATIDAEGEWGVAGASPGLAAAKLVVIDDDPAILRLVELIAAENGYSVVSAATGAAGLRLILETEPDLVLLDLVLPDMSGVEVCRRLRSAGAKVTVLMISCLQEPQDVIVGLEVGADDYLRKPFEVRELVARINARLRRAQLTREAGNIERLRFPGLTIDLGRHEVRRDGRPVALTPTEFKILVTLARQSGAVVPRPELIAEVWRNRDPYRVHSLDAHLYRLRRKVQPREDGAHYLHAVIGAGYRFEYQPPCDQPQQKPVPFLELAR